MPNRKFVTVDQFREEARGGSAGDDVAVRLGMRTAVRAPSAEAVERIRTDKITPKPDPERLLEFTISTPSIDRYGDTIQVDGWQLDNYRSNPVVLWAHDYRSLPVARCLSVWVESGALVAIADFTPSGPSWPRFNDTIFEMYKGGFLSATSVGLMPLEWKWVDEGGRFGLDFLKSELLEWSAVVVPANPEALINARTAGIDTGPVAEWAERFLDGEGRSVVPRAELEALRKAAAPARKLIYIETPQTLSAEGATRLRDHVARWRKGKIPALVLDQSFKLREVEVPEDVALRDGDPASDDPAAPPVEARTAVEALPPDEQLALAGEIAQRNGHVLMTRSRVEAVERAARQKRLDEARAARARDLELINIRGHRGR